MARKYKRDKNGRFAGGSSLSDRISRYDTYKRVAGYAGAAAGLAAAGYVGHKALTSRRIKATEMGSKPVPKEIGETNVKKLPPKAETETRGNKPMSKSEAESKLKGTERLYFRVQPAGLGLNHRSETSSGELADGLHVFVNPGEAESLSEGIGYGDEVVVLKAPRHWSNGDAEGVEVNGAKASVLARIPHAEFRASDWE